MPIKSFGNMLMLGRSGIVVSAASGPPTFNIGGISQGPGANQVSIEFDNSLDENSVPDPTDFVVEVDGAGGPGASTAVTIINNGDGTSTVIITTTNNVGAGDITVSYTPGAGDPLQDVNGNPVSGFSDIPESGGSAPPTEPEVNSIYTYGTTGIIVVVSLNGLVLDTGNSVSAPADWVVTINGNPVTVTSVLISGGNTVTLAISGGDTSGTVVVTYNPTGSNVIYTNQGVELDPFGPASAVAGHLTAHVGGVVGRMQATLTPALITSVEAVFTTLSTTADKLDVLVLAEFSGCKNEHDGKMNWMKDSSHAQYLGTLMSWVKDQGFVRQAVSGVGWMSTDWRAATQAVEFGKNNVNNFREGSFGVHIGAAPTALTALVGTVSDADASIGGRQSLSYVPASTHYGYSIDTANRNTGGGSQANPPPIGFKMVNAIQNSTNLQMGVFQTATTSPVQVGSLANQANGDVIVDEVNRMAIGRSGTHSAGITISGWFIGGGMDSNDRNRLASMFNSL